jgi:uracil-DNA glycosylase
MENDIYYMSIALSLAEKAGNMGEVPIGAIVVDNQTGEIAGQGYNMRECDFNPLAHAEISAIYQASRKLKRWRLSNCSLYVTLEPCPMCCGAVINSRIDHVYFGAYDKKAGSVVSMQNMFSMPYNHKPEFTGGIMEKECADLLSVFFKNLRKITDYIRGEKMVNIENEWDELLKDEFEKDYYKNLRQFLITEYKTRTIYPNMYNIFNALKYTDYHNVKAVIIGQDPYHGPNQAHGLSFSVQKGVVPPPSLVNIFKEIKSDTGIDNLGKHGELTKWAEEGVLLLNTVLTVRAGQANSHKNKGWENFTDKVIELLNQRDTPLVFMLWGANAKSKTALITNPKHLILTSAHPSPLSAYNGFFGCRHFSKANEFLRNNGIKEIDWSIE